MKSRLFRALEVAVVSLMFAAPSTAQNSSPATSSRGRPELHAFRVAHPPVIDGALDDEAWTHPPMETTEWLSYNPLNGDRIPQQTHVWVAYDDNYFYFAFKCDDPEPAAHQDFDRPARQRVERRLGRPQPRRPRNGPAVVSHAGESERHPDGYAQQRGGW